MATIIGGGTTMSFQDLLEIALGLGMTYAEASSMTYEALKAKIVELQAGGPAGATTDVQGDIENALQQSAFSAGLGGAGYKTEGPLGSLLRQQFEPAQAAFNTSRYLQGADLGSPAPNNGFQNYTTAMGPNAYSNARKVYGQVRSGTPFQSPSLSDALFKSGVGNTPEQRGFQRQYQNLARGAASAQYSPMAAEFLPSEDTINRLWAKKMYEDAQSGGAGVNLAELLRQQFGF